MSNPDDQVLPVLIVDDDPFIRDILRDVLEDAGYRVVSAAHGREALALLDRQRVALIVTDLMMPQLGGVELLHQLRSNPALAEVPVIAMSAASANTQGTSFSTFLPKPFEIEVLLSLVQRFYRRQARGDG